MIPKYFKEADIELKKPESMSDDECSSLWVLRSDGSCISLWTATFWERVKFLFHGNVWIWVVSGNTQPPIALDMKKTIFGEVVR